MEAPPPLPGGSGSLPGAGLLGTRPFTELRLAMESLLDGLGRPSVFSHRMGTSNPPRDLPVDEALLSSSMSSSSLSPPESLSMNAMTCIAARIVSAFRCPTDMGWIDLPLGEVGRSADATVTPLCTLGIGRCLVPLVLSLLGVRLSSAPSCSLPRPLLCAMLLRPLLGRLLWRLLWRLLRRLPSSGGRAGKSDRFLAEGHVCTGRATSEPNESRVR
mmetsp:Transcript_107321/g.303423  ORF Transcript_107321/g.303423 Transcript_107321/m.303423 type:complete len:216 (-) Transcript_107321:172-819(-)